MLGGGGGGERLCMIGVSAATRPPTGLESAGNRTETGDLVTADLLQPRNIVGSYVFVFSVTDFVL